MTEIGKRIKTVTIEPQKIPAPAPQPVREPVPA